jgi:hypothetical protein
VLLVGSAILLVACAGGGGGRHGAPVGTPPTASSPSVSPSGASAPGHTSGAAASPHLDLASLLVTPKGYAVSTSSDVHNGPISVSQFNNLAGENAASEVGFVNGYDVTYDSQTTSDYVEITLVTARSPSLAAAAVAKANGARSVGFTVNPYPDIPNAFEFATANLSSDGSLIHAVVAARGSTVMFFTYTTDHTGPPPGDFRTWVDAQFNRLPG